MSELFQQQNRRVKITLVRFSDPWQEMIVYEGADLIKGYKMNDALLTVFREIPNVYVKKYEYLEEETTNGTK